MPAYDGDRERIILIGVFLFCGEHRALISPYEYTEVKMLIIGGSVFISMLQIRTRFIKRFFFLLLWYFFPSYLLLVYYMLTMLWFKISHMSYSSTWRMCFSLKFFFFISTVQMLSHKKKYFQSFSYQEYVNCL